MKGGVPRAPFPRAGQVGPGPAWSRRRGDLVRAPRPWRCLAPPGGQRGPAAPPGHGEPPAGAGALGALPAGPQPPPRDAEPGPGVRDQPQVPALALLDRSRLLPCPYVS